jgi:hypothetical protein
MPIFTKSDAARPADGSTVLAATLGPVTDANSKERRK